MFVFTSWIGVEVLYVVVLMVVVVGVLQHQVPASD